MKNEILSAIKAYTDPLKRRILLMFARAVVGAINDSGGIQVLDLGVFEDEERDAVERFQDYGLSSNPPVGSQAIVAFFGGQRDRGIVLRVEAPDYRPTDLEPGEVALYDKDGNYLKLATGNEMHARADKFKFQGDSEELMDLLVQLAEACEVAQTAVGPLLNSATFALIKTKLEAMKV